MDYKLAEQHHLLRLNFAPQHIIDGKVIPSAISTEDLQRRGYSLDSEALISIETLIERAASQSARNPEERKSPHISRFLCGDAASIKYDDIYAFNIFHSPILEDIENDTKANQAHVSLLCTDTSKTNSYYKKAKLLLLPVLQNLITLQNYVEALQAEKAPEEEAPPSSK